MGKFKAHKTASKHESIWKLHGRLVMLEVVADAVYVIMVLELMSSRLSIYNDKTYSAYTLHKNSTH
jgi:hypothetical protein